VFSLHAFFLQLYVIHVADSTVGASDSTMGSTQALDATEVKTTSVWDYARSPRRRENFRNPRYRAPADSRVGPQSFEAADAAMPPPCPDVCASGGAALEPGHTAARHSGSVLDSSLPVFYENPYRVCWIIKTLWGLL
jgi:hypothetical protein